MNNQEKIALLKTRLAQIGHSVATTPHTLALIGLGSAGQEDSRMDAYSDLDFFLVVENGYKLDFLQNLSWLTDVAQVVYSFKNTADGYKLLYADDVFCEFAVFELNELHHADYAPGKLIWCNANVPSNLATPAKSPPEPNTEVAFLLGELLTNIYVGLGRYLRGERVSASYFIQHYAVNRLIELIRATENPSGNSIADPWSAERRFEAHYPHHANLLQQCTQSNSINCAKLLLGHITCHYQPNSVMVSKIEKYIAVIQSI